MAYLDILIFLAIGLGSGFLAGLLGIGGGIVVVPSLLLYFQLLQSPLQVQMQLAVGTSLAAMVLTTASAGISHYRKKAVDFSFAAFLGIGNIGGAICGAYLTGTFPSRWLQIVFGIFECLIGIRFFFPQKQRPDHRKAPPRWTLIGVGFIVATLATILGIGGGLVQVPVLAYFGLSIKRAIGTASVLSFFIALTGSLSLVFLGIQDQPIPNTAGFVYLPAFIGIGLASILAAPWGVKLVHHCPTGIMRKIFALILLIIGLIVIAKA
ncbi:MAG: sulfite exporter TauE/SafE family protein [Chlamydiota bacterium]